MQAVTLQPRPLFGIGTVARLTGVKPDTLRVWERRYQLGASYKSDSGRRQYTQADLEHLQLVAALVADGTRIGEIASLDRKTLEMLLRERGTSRASAGRQGKPRVVFIGEALCDWLDNHQGCLAGVDAQLAALAPATVDPALFSHLEGTDILVLESRSPADLSQERVLELRDLLQAGSVLVLHRQQDERWRRALASAGVETMTFPPEPPALAFHLSSRFAEAATSTGGGTLGELVAGGPPRYSRDELEAAARLKVTAECECPAHISGLIKALAEFEEYSASCSIDNWREAAVHSCIYAYTGQARRLMEKALGAVLEGREEEFQRELGRIEELKLDDLRRPQVARGQT